MEYEVCHTEHNIYCMMRNPEVGTMLTNYIVGILYFNIVQAKQNHIVSLLSLLHVDLFQYTQPITNNSLQQFTRIFPYLSFMSLVFFGYPDGWQSGNLGRHYSHSVERERLRPSERSRPWHAMAAMGNVSSWRRGKHGLPAWPSQRLSSAILGWYKWGSI